MWGELFDCSDLIDDDDEKGGIWFICCYLLKNLVVECKCWKKLNECFYFLWVFVFKIIKVNSNILKMF